MNHPTQHTERQHLQILDEWWGTLMRHLANMQELAINDPQTASTIIHLTDLYAQQGRGASAPPRRAQPAKILSFVARHVPKAGSLDECPRAGD